MRLHRSGPLPEPEGWTSTSIPSLEERLDDHQPTRAWENGEGPG